MNFTIFFTNQCNMNCTYCYEGNKKQQSISFPVMNQVIDFIIKEYLRSERDGLSVVTHGGEPLLVFEKIKYFVEKLSSKITDVKYIITTNATLLDDEMIDFLAENYSEISVSIDGTQLVHDQNRMFSTGEGTYSVVVENAKKLLARTPDVKARMTINPETVCDLYNSVKHLLNLGFRNVLPVPDTFCTSWTTEDMDTLNEQGELIIEHVKTFPESTNVGLINDSLAKCVNAPCDGGVTTFSIDTDGTIYPCVVAVGLEEFALGSVAMNMDPAKLEKIREWDTVEIKPCQGCSRYNYCSTTRCRIMNKILSGGVHTPSPVICNIENVKVKLSEYYMHMFPV